MEHDVIEAYSIGGRRVSQLASGRLVVEGWPNEIYATLEIVARLLALERESRHLAAINRRLVLLGGEPIPARRGFRIDLDELDREGTRQRDLPRAR